MRRTVLWLPLLLVAALVAACGDGESEPAAVAAAPAAAPADLSGVLVEMHQAPG